jgi:hypothetical protein
MPFDQFNEIVDYLDMQLLNAIRELSCGTADADVSQRL